MAIGFSCTMEYTNNANNKFNVHQLVTLFYVLLGIPAFYMQFSSHFLSEM